jgi:hypothetical protein
VAAPELCSKCPMNVTNFMPVASLVLACVFWTGLGFVLLTVVPGLRRTVQGVFAFVVGALAGSLGVGRLTAALFIRPDGAAPRIPILLLQLAIGLASAVGLGLFLAWLMERNWPKKT